MRWLVGFVLPACVIAEKRDEADLVCAELPEPSVAANTVTITGVVRTITGAVITDGVMIEGFASGLPLPPTESDANGAFSYMHETGGVPVIDHIVATRPPFVPTDAYFGHPIFEDAVADIRMVTMEDALQFTTTAGVIIDPALGVVLLRTTDCNESPVGGATVTSEPAGDVFYFRFAAPSPAATDTDASGITMIANLPIGDVEISGAIDDVSMRSQTVTTSVDTFVLTLVRP